MSSEKISDSVAPLQPPKKGDKIEVVKVLVLAVVSFVLGFGLVILFLGPGKSSKTGDLDLGGDGDREGNVSAIDEREGAPAGQAPTGGNGYAPGAGDNPLLAATGAATGEGAGDGDEAEAEAEASEEGSAPVEVPPGRTPEGVGLKGGAFYLKCWDGEGNESPGSACDKLTVFEKRFSTRLYVVDRCKKIHAGEKSEGKLSLGVEVDFDNRALSYWNGASSEIENAAKVATCLRAELAGLPIHSVDHKFSKYRMFFTVIFGKGSALASTPLASPDKSADKAPGESAGAGLPKGKTVNVVMDKVRVRKAPEDGDIIGKISSGNEVKLVGKKNGWCEVITPNNNRGWMTCEALSK